MRIITRNDVLLLVKILCSISKIPEPSNRVFETIVARNTRKRLANERYIKLRTFHFANFPKTRRVYFYLYF